MLKNIEKNIKTMKGAMEDNKKDSIEVEVSNTVFEVKNVNILHGIKSNQMTQKKRLMN